MMIKPQKKDSVEIGLSGTWVQNQSNFYVKTKITNITKAIIRLQLK